MRPIYYEATKVEKYNAEKAKWANHPNLAEAIFG